jgi:hypothetical protein
VQLSFLDKASDKVGPGSQATPDGRPDGHFQVTVTANDTVTAIDLRTADANGKPCCGQVWNTVPNDGFWILGVFRGGTQLNPVDENISDPVAGSVTYDVYGSDSGFFNAGQRFVVSVSFASGSCVAALAQIGGPSTAGGTCSGGSSQPFPVTSGPVTGTVLVQAPGTTTFVPLTAGASVPNGTVIDATKGTVTLPAPGGSDVFSTGIFSVLSTFETLPGRKQPIVELRLTKESLKACGRKTAAVGANPTKPVNSLWGKGTGHFRTRGRYAAATVRGTNWLTQDRCDGTLVRVRQGKVEVLDLITKKKIVLTAGKSYLAHR